MIEVADGKIRLTLEFNGEAHHVDMARAEVTHGLTRDQVFEKLSPMLRLLSWNVEHELNKEIFG